MAKSLEVDLVTQGISWYEFVIKATLYPVGYEGSIGLPSFQKIFQVITSSTRTIGKTK